LKCFTTRCSDVLGLLICETNEVARHASPAVILARSSGLPSRTKSFLKVKAKAPDLLVRFRGLGKNMHMASVKD
jgi:hypothetical protein